MQIHSFSAYSALGIEVNKCSRVSICGMLVGSRWPDVWYKTRADFFLAQQNIFHPSPSIVFLSRGVEE